MDSSSVHIKGESSVVRPIKDKIRAYCKQKRVRLVEFFKTFDVHRTKRVSRNQFIRALALALEGLEISTQECDLLASRYQIASEPDMVNYLKFVDQIDKVFVVKNLEKSPQNSVQLHAAGSEKPRVGEDHPSLSAIEKEELKEALATISHIVQTQGVILKMFFQDFDAANNGCVTPEQFRRALGGVAGRLLADRDVALVARAYALTPTAVSYRELHERVTPALAAAAAAAGRGAAAAVHPAPLPSASDEAPQGARRGSGPDDLSRLELRLALAMAQRRLFLADLFREADPARVGRCTRAQFQQVVGRHFAVPLADEQLAALAHKYRLGPADVRYPAFVAALEALAGRDGAQVPGTRPAPTALRAVSLGASEAAELGAYLRHTKTYTEHKRMLLAPPFQDFDPRREGHVTREQFCRVLSRFDVLPPAPALREALLRAFAGTDHRHPPHQFVHYAKFLRAVARGAWEEEGEGEEENAPAAAAAGGGSRPGSRSGRLGTAGSALASGGGGGCGAGGAAAAAAGAARGGQGRPGSAAAARQLAFGRADRTLEQVVAGVQARALAGRWRLADYFQDLDRLRHGLVTEAQFRRALGFHGLRLTEGEVRALVGRYGRASRRGNQAMVSYVQFVAEVEAVFGVQGLERDPTLDVDRTVASVQRTGQTSLDAAAAALAGPPSPGLPGGGGGGAGLSRAERELLGETLRGLAALVRTKRLELLPPFADFDPLRRGHVGAAKFERALSRLGLLPGAAACRLLRRQFREHGAAGNAEEVNYRAFAAAVEGLLLRGGPGAGEVPGEELELPTAAAFRRGVREGGGGPAGGGGGGGGGAMAGGPGGHSIDAMARSMLGLKVEREVAAAEGGADKALAVCLAGLRRELAARAVRLRDFLGAQDRFRSGEVTRARFANALAVAGLRLSAAQLELVSDAFASDKRRDMVDWQAFLKRMEKTEDPHANMAASQSVEEADKLEEILGRIRTTTRQRCLFLRPFFQDYDRNNRWQVTKTQMFAVLDNIGLKLTDEERDILFAAFQVREGVQLTNRMNYKNFVREVDDIEER